MVEDISESGHSLTSRKTPNGTSQSSRASWSSRLHGRRRASARPVDSARSRDARNVVGESKVESWKLKVRERMLPGFFAPANILRGDAVIRESARRAGGVTMGRFVSQDRSGRVSGWSIAACCAIVVVTFLIISWHRCSCQCAEWATLPTANPD